MPRPKNPPAAGPDEDPNVELRPYSSPPCYAHEVDPAYFGMPRRPDLPRLRRLVRRLEEAEAALHRALDALPRR